MSSNVDAWLAEIVPKLDAAGYRVTPVYRSGRSQPFSEAQTYPDPLHPCYADAEYVGLVLDDCVLLDWDGYKSDSISLDALVEAIGVLRLPEPLQANVEGTSLHWLFRLPADSGPLRQSRDSWLPGVDVKTGNQLMHIKPQKVLRRGVVLGRESLPVAPAALVSALAKQGDHNSMLTALPEVASEEQVEQARYLLQFLDPDMPYSDWIRVLMALHSFFGASDDGVNLADDWSRHGSKYKGRSEIEYKFSSFDAGGGVRINTLIYMAQKAGADVSSCSLAEHDVRADFDQLHSDTEWPEITSSNYLSELPRRWVFVSESNLYFDRLTHATVAAPALNTQYSHIMRLNDNNKLVSIRAADVIGKSREKMVVHNIGWCPRPDEIVEVGTKRVVNTYTGPLIHPAAGVPDVWLDLMNHVYGEYVDLVVGHMAFSVQRPDEKIRWQIMVVSDKKRTGKSSTIAPLKKIFEHEHQVVSADDLDTGWGDFSFGKKVIVVEEVYRPGGSKKFFNQIKAGLVNSDIEALNLKGRGVVRQRNMRSYYLFTNHWNAIAFDLDEDKLLIVAAPDTPWRGCFRAYHRAIEHDDLAGRVYRYLLDYDLGSFPYDRLPVRTPALRRMCEESAPDYQQWIREMIDSRQYPFACPVVTFDYVRRNLKSAGFGRFGNDGIGAALKAAGYVSVKARFQEDGRRSQARVWLPEQLASIATEREMYQMRNHNGLDGVAEHLSDVVRKWISSNGYCVDSELDDGFEF